MSGRGPAVDGPQDARRRGLTPGMRRVLLIVGALTAVGLAMTLWLSVGGGGSLLSGTPGGGAAAPGDSSSGDSAPGTQPTPSDGGPLPETTPGPVPEATPTTGSEVPDPDPTAPPGNRLPPLPQPSPLVDPPLPASASASGTLVDGFPRAIMAPAPGSDVITSAIATDGDRMQVTLVARSDASADDVRAHYSTLWASLGLTDAGSAPGGASFSHSFATLSLAFSPPGGTGTVYAVYGVFRSS